MSWLPEYTKCAADLAAATATLERVRAIVNDRLLFSQMVPRIRATLAGQPEAPCSDCGTTTEERSPCPSCRKVFCLSCAEKPYAFCCAGQPEAPKGQEAAPLSAREHARRRGSLDGADAQALEGALSQSERDLAAANTRIAKLETERAEQMQARREDWDLEKSLRKELAAANARADSVEAHFEQCHEDWKRELARADAAERKLNQCLEHSDSQCEEWLKLRDERDQLAARVRELQEGSWPGR
jgi:hypothetical protein